MQGEISYDIEKAKKTNATASMGQSCKEKCALEYNNAHINPKLNKYIIYIMAFNLKIYEELASIKSNHEDWVVIKETC